MLIARRLLRSSGAIGSHCIFPNMQNPQKSFLTSSLSTSKPYSASSFLRSIRVACNSYDPRGVSVLLKNKTQLDEVLGELNQGIIGPYLHENFIFWLNAYARQEADFCTNYLMGSLPLNALCRDFIRFCFDRKIYLDPAETLASFAKHNEFSDKAVRNELEKITPKSEINLLGFGLDDGHYEQQLAHYLVASGKAKTVNVLGFDPYANRNPAIYYLSADELSSDKWEFDLVVVRWVLHHVEMQYRWSSLINCINRCKPGAEVLIVEHGFLAEATPFDRRVGALLNAIFDIVANIGLRPGYFLNAKRLGDDFFIHYLEPKDFSEIGSHVSVNMGLKIYDVGPTFPNQTICKMTIKP